MLASDGELQYDFLGNSTHDLTFQRQRFTYSGMVNACIRKSLSPFILGLSISYRHGFNNIVNTDERFTDQNLVFDRGYQPDDLRLNSFHLDLELIVPVPIAGR